jgi:hypothetical protein
MVEGLRFSSKNPKTLRNQGPDWRNFSSGHLTPNALIWRVFGGEYRKNLEISMFLGPKNRGFLSPKIEVFLGKMQKIEVFLGKIGVPKFGGLNRFIHSARVAQLCSKRRVSFGASRPPPTLKEGQNGRFLKEMTPTCPWEGRFGPTFSIWRLFSIAGLTRSRPPRLLFQIGTLFRF